MVKPIKGTPDIAPIAHRMIRDFYSRCLRPAAFEKMIDMKAVEAVGDDLGSDLGMECLVKIICSDGGDTYAKEKHQYGCCNHKGMMLLLARLIAPLSLGGVLLVKHAHLEY